MTVRQVLFGSVAALFALSSAHAQTTPPPGFTGAVDTRIGKIDLPMGLPANSDVEKKIYDEMDYQRASQAYIWAIPIVAMNEWKRAHLGPIGGKPRDLVLYNNYKDKLGILTANFTTPYIITFDNVESGP